MHGLKSLFLLDKNTIYLNHGSFGACPQPVMEVYQEWQVALERQPTMFLDRNFDSLMYDSRLKLAQYVGVSADDIVYFTNPSTAINMVIHSLANNPKFRLKQGDEILTTNHEYGAMNRAWNFYCSRIGAVYRQQDIPLAIPDQNTFLEKLWLGVNEHTRVIFLSHITSPTSLTFPVQEICQRARDAGILTVVDGAHAPGQIDLDLNTISPDIYVGACHKWLCAPKGSSFLYANPIIHPFLDPLVVSWGYLSEKPSGSLFIDYHQWQGTRDIAAFLTVPSAIDFQNTHNWKNVRASCHELIVSAREKLYELTSQEPIYPNGFFHQMASFKLPRNTNSELLQSRLLTDFFIEVPIFEWDEEKLIRISCQGYNSEKDIDQLIKALDYLLPISQL